MELPSCWLILTKNCTSNQIKAFHYNVHLDTFLQRTEHEAATVPPQQNAACRLDLRQSTRPHQPRQGQQHIYGFLYLAPGEDYLREEVAKSHVPIIIGAEIQIGVLLVIDQTNHETNEK